MPNLRIRRAKVVLMFKLGSRATRHGGSDMNGTILDVVNAGSFWLVIVHVGRRILEQVIEPRYMWDIVEGEGLESPSDLVGRRVEIAEDRMSIAFV